MSTIPTRCLLEENIVCVKYIFFMFCKWSSFCVGYKNGRGGVKSRREVAHVIVKCSSLGRLQRRV